VSNIVIGTATISDPTGLHARPAVKFAKLAKTFHASVEVSTADGAWVNAKSTNSLMKMKATFGTPLTIRARGLDAQTAVQKLVQLITRDFEAQ
jgi:phosphocarrier protein HPr